MSPGTSPRAAEARQSRRETGTDGKVRMEEGRKRLLADGGSRKDPTSPEVGCLGAFRLPQSRRGGAVEDGQAAPGLRGGLREAELLLAEVDAVGDGVDIILTASSCDISDILSNVSGTVVN